MNSLCPFALALLGVLLLGALGPAYVFYLEVREQKAREFYDRDSYNEEAP